MITLSVLSGMRKATSLSEFRLDFAQRRWWRIAPLYLLTLLVYLFLVDPNLLRQGVSAITMHLGAHLFFVHNLWPVSHGSINGPNWSVALEMQFYLLRLMIGPWLIRQRAIAVVLGLAAFAMAYRAVVFLWCGGEEGQAWIIHVYTTQLPGALDEFGAGIALAIAFQSGRLRALCDSGWLAFFFWSTVSAVLLGVAMHIYWQRAAYWPHWEMVVFWRGLLALGFAGVVAALAVVPARLNALMRPFRYLGEISYGLYLWHLPVLLTLVGAGMTGGMELLALTLLGTGLLAAGSWHYFEQPLLQRGRPKKASAQFDSRRETAAQTSSTLQAGGQTAR